MAGYNLIPAFFNALGSNISESEKARKEGEQRAAKDNQQPGYQSSQAPELDRSNFTAGSPATTGANIIGDIGGTFGKTLFGKAIEGEADLYAPNMQAVGGFAVQPTDYTSAGGSTPYKSSAMADYLNYMNTRGGY